MADGDRVRFVDAALGVHTAASAPRRIVRYSNHSFGTTHEGAVSHYDLHLNKPPQLETWTTHGASLDVRDIIRRYKASATSIALKLDVEGASHRRRRRRSGGVAAALPWQRCHQTGD